MQNDLPNLKPVTPPDAPMPPVDIGNGKKLIAVFLAVVASVPVTCVAFGLWMLLGYFTHVEQISPFPISWWGVAYVCLLPSIFIPGYFVGKRIERWYLQREKAKYRIE